MHCRQYDPDADRAGLWRAKRAFERELAARTGGEAKLAAYEAKLTDAYRERYLDWVDRCVAESADCVAVAVDADDEPGRPRLGGYSFLLPDSMALVWDAAVLNELYVVPECRGAGVADELLETALSAARAQDLPLDRLVLDVDTANRRGQAFYGRHGFEPWGELVARQL